MQEVIKIFNAIRNTNSTLEKKKIISQNQDNELFKQCLVFLLDSNIVTGIKDSKLKKVNPAYVAQKATVKFDTFPELMTYLMTHNTGTDNDIANVKGFIYDHPLPDDEFEFYVQMVTKKFRLGCDKKIVNSIIPGLIPSWEIQQAFPLDDKNKPKHGEWFSLSQKLNGINCGVYHGKLISRQGKEFVGMDHILEDLRKLLRKNMFFNGELIRKNTDHLSDSQNFQIGTGIINADLKTDKSCIKFVIYEMFPGEEFERGKSRLTYRQRKEQYLLPLAEKIQKLGLENIEVVPFVYEGNDLTQVQSLLEQAEANGWEGLMLNKDTCWQNRRNNGILKVKSFKHSDVLCVDVEEGDGRNKGKLGNIICDFKGHPLGVGSGFTDDEREFYWRNPQEIVGHYVQIKYKGETTNKQGGVSVQFPVFEYVRTDKSLPSYES